MARVPTVEALSPYADFYQTMQMLESARNRVINGCRCLAPARTPQNQMNDIVQLSYEIHQRLLAAGKKPIGEIRKHLVLAANAHLAKDTATKTAELANANKWCQALNNITRDIMKVVTVLSDVMIEHQPAEDARGNPTPARPVDEAVRPDMSKFVVLLRDIRTRVGST